MVPDIGASRGIYFSIALHALFPLIQISLGAKALLCVTNSDAVWTTSPQGEIQEVILIKGDDCVTWVSRSGSLTTRLANARCAFHR